jgi:hypothetical protein
MTEAMLASHAGGEARATDLLINLARNWPDSRISVGDLLHALGDRGLGLLMLVLALPNMVPLPFLGISSLLGTPIAILAVHLIIGRHEPWLPHFVRRRGVGAADLATMLERAKRRMAWAERRLQPGTLKMTRGVEIAAGVNLFVNAVLLALPIPWGNPAPALGIALISIALVEADARLFRIAMAIGVVTILIDLALAGAVVGLVLAALGFAAGQL